VNAPSPVPYPTHIRVRPGPALLADLEVGPSLAAHRERYDALPRLDADALHGLVDRARVRGRGGAGFPFATKLDAVRTRTRRTRRAVVVVNLSEGEPASAKDSVLALHRPHLVLDGAVAAARALGTREVHVVLPGERDHVAAAMTAAVGERDDGLDVRLHTAEPRFVAGQARAVLELLAGRPNLPVTAWQPEAFEGHRGRPTLLSNAETWAHVGLLALRGAESYGLLGTDAEPGTTLLTVNDLTRPDGTPEVVEVEHGSRLRDVLPTAALDAPSLVGGFHGAWATGPTLAGARVSAARLKAVGVPLGAGVLVVPGRDACPLALTVQIVDHLAGQSARRCGPCFNGLPALAAALHRVLDGSGSRRRVAELSGLVERRGACAHPDGTIRLVSSLLSTLGTEVRAHEAGACVRRPLRTGGAA
jgi:NADH:ubiquinone oxidoreductase subunit F (NADH-binding)